MNQDSAAFLRAIKGPVMMITIGVLFALDNFTGLSFGRTWPVLLVVIGLLSLGGSSYRGGPSGAKFQYKAQWGPPSSPPPPPPGSSAPPSSSTAPPGTYRGSSYQAAPGPHSTDDPGATQ